MSVKKEDFVNRMAETGGITKKAARQGVELFIETLIDCMHENEKVMFKGFGRFEMRTCKERICKSPIGGGDCIIPEHKKIRFTPSDLLADRIEETGGEE